MAAASCVLNADQFRCSICVDVFTDPVTTPCGHNFCKSCITQHWNINDPCRQHFALKSCLVCLASYCDSHLEPHRTKSGLRRHQLIDPVENLEGRMCPKHDKLMELFCETDQTCVCMICTVLDHRTHDVVPLEEGRLKIKELKHSAELVDSIREKQREMEELAEDFIKELEQEICELEKRSSEVGQLSESEDHLHLLQSFLSVSAVPPTRDWTEVSILPVPYEVAVVIAVKELVETLREQVKGLLELKRVQKHAVELTLDPDTAHPHLILSEDGRQVRHGDVWKNLPDKPWRFSVCPDVLAEQSFSSGRFYYEVQVRGKMEWVLGVAKESIDRMGQIAVIPQKGYWTICLRKKNEYRALTIPPVLLSPTSRPDTVGVFVDCEEGLVCFYDVKAPALIYSFTGCCFPGRLYPFFSPGHNFVGDNSAPLIVPPVNHTV
uniref:Uncharacterized protein n=1 Tax=Mola mola TaxID=94237 RepID=A0A3Q3WVJ9_MOLML